MRGTIMPQRSILSPEIAAEKICSETIFQLTCRRSVKLSERNTRYMTQTSCRVQSRFNEIIVRVGRISLAFRPSKYPDRYKITNYKWRGEDDNSGMPRRNTSRRVTSNPKTCASKFDVRVGSENFRDKERVEGGVYDVSRRDKWTVELKCEYINGDFRVNHLLRRAA